ncbi:MAG: hypothetical protein AAGL29_16575, partial [Bacteroidota bacterium]
EEKRVRLSCEFCTRIWFRDRERRAFAEDGGRFVNPINFIDKTRQTLSQTVFTNTLAFDRDFEKHSVNASAVLEQTRIRFESTSISDNNEVSSVIPEAFSPNARATSFSVPENLNSILFLGGYEYDNRYSISGSGRRDTSSRFSPENASQWFFSGALGWNISNEPWFDVEAVNSLKLRASYGETGNNRTGNAVNQFLPTLGLNLPTALNDETSAGISPNNAANPDLRWETQIKQNYGFSSAFLYDQIKNVAVEGIHTLHSIEKHVEIPTIVFRSKIDGISKVWVWIADNSAVIQADEPISIHITKTNISRLYGHRS